METTFDWTSDTNTVELENQLDNIIKGGAYKKRKTSKKKVIKEKKF